jgi:hypothetical protein
VSYRLTQHSTLSIIYIHAVQCALLVGYTFRFARPTSRHIQVCILAFTTEEHTIFWDVEQCGSIEVHQSFRRSYCPRLHEVGKQYKINILRTLFLMKSYRAWKKTNGNTKKFRNRNCVGYIEGISVGNTECSSCVCFHSVVRMSVL